MDYKLEVVTIAVTDVDEARDSYETGLGFRLDVDWTPTPELAWCK